jgi:uncharacterized membrane-anchored protein YhcB (DUF1043 family)
MVSIGNIIQIIVMLVGLGAIYGAIQTRLNENERKFEAINEELKTIKTQLGNHIQHISDDIRQICERLARMEGKFNGR